MKMILQTRHTKKWQFLKNPFKLSILIFVLVIFFWLFIFGVARSFVSDLLSPVFKFGGFINESIGLVPKFFYYKNKLIQENQNLLDKINNENLAMTDYEAMKEENKKLREELKLKPVGNFVTTSIIARSPQLPLDSLLVDRGQNDGVQVGDLVLSGERILIGNVISVSQNTATVILNSSANKISSGYLARTNEAIEIKGGGSSMEAKVPIDFDIQINDKIMSHGSFNCLFAIVGAITEDHSSGFKEILLSLPVSISKIDLVFIFHTVNESH